MSTKARDTLIKWHAAQTGEWCFMDELYKYCRTDVMVLVGAVQKFHELLMKEFDVSPFTCGAVSIASLTSHVYRKCFLQPNTIGIVPKGAYRKNDKQSALALQWLLWVQHGYTAAGYQVHIQTALSPGGEHRIGKYKVDGYHAPSNTVYEVNGCLW